MLKEIISSKDVDIDFMGEGSNNYSNCNVMFSLFDQNIYCESFFYEYRAKGHAEIRQL